jgi:hypothetical protein
MTIRCDYCGELIWFIEASDKWLRCNACGKTQNNPVYKAPPVTTKSGDDGKE